MITHGIPGIICCNTNLICLQFFSSLWCMVKNNLNAMYYVCVLITLWNSLKVLQKNFSYRRELSIRQLAVILLRKTEVLSVITSICLKQLEPFSFSQKFQLSIGENVSYVQLTMPLQSLGNLTPYFFDSLSPQIFS